MLFIAEKPDVAKAIVKALGGNFSSKDGYLTDGNNTVTWCFGHMMKLKDPKDYDNKYKFWNLNDLPFVFLPYERKDNPNTVKQLRVIKDLIKKSEIIVNAGDPDDEGQLLVDEILREVKNKKPVKRILINDNNIKVVQKAISNMVDNSKYEFMGYQAEARAVADQLLGYNLTRSYTINHRAKTKEKDVISIGRVQSAVLGLVVRRCREHASHKKAFYYNLLGKFIIDNTIFSAKFIPTDLQKKDDKNRLIDENEVNKIASLCKDKPSTVIFAETEEKRIQAPLPFNLIKLQQACAKKFDYSLTKTLEITQSLREKHQLITYNRSDCQYLSEEQHLDAKNVLDCIKQNLPHLNNVVDSSNYKIKGRVFNDKLVTAHHAIIPSETIADLSKLNQDEKNVYELISTAYIAQFYPDYQYLQTKIIVSVDDYNFTAISNIPTQQGWKEVFENIEDAENENEDVESTDLRQLKVNDLGVCSDVLINKEVTKPLPLYTLASLAGDLTSAAKYIKNPELVKVLKERDKDKKGENGGIGTPATRNVVIDTLLARNFIKVEKKKVISTDLGEALYNQLSDLLRYPDLTAVWTQKFNEIKDQSDVVNFINFVMKNHIEPEVNQIKANCPIEPKEPKKEIPCPKCGRSMTLRDGKFGKYWGCSGYFDKQNQCKNIMNDDNGVPVPAKPKPKESSENAEKLFIKVDYADKDKVKALGAKWDGNNKSWYINSEDKEKFSEWVK